MYKASGKRQGRIVYIKPGSQDNHNTLVVQGVFPLDTFHGGKIQDKIWDKLSTSKMAIKVSLDIRCYLCYPYNNTDTGNGTSEELIKNNI